MSEESVPLFLIADRATNFCLVLFGLDQVCKLCLIKMKCDRQSKVIKKRYNQAEISILHSKI